MIAIASLSDFFNRDTPDPDWYGEEEKAQSSRFRELMALLSDNLTHVKVFRVGQIEVDIYILGQAQNGERVGLLTKAIET